MEVGSRHRRHKGSLISKEDALEILWVKAGGLVPLDTGGKIRSYHILAELSRIHRVTLFTFYAAHPDDAHAELERPNLRVVRWPLWLSNPKSLGDYFDYARHLLSPHPYSMTKYCRPEAARGLRQLLKSENYDVIICDFLQSAGVIPWHISCPKVLFAHNVEAMIWQRHYQVARNLLWKAVCWHEYRRMAGAERCYAERADHVLTVSETDREVFARLINPAKISAIPTGVDTDYFRPTPGDEQPNTLVFTGSMDWLPNEDSIFYFLGEILPHIRAEVPEVSLWVVGRRPPRQLQELSANNTRVRVTGRVEDIRPYVQRAAVYIVPLRVGSGTRLKIFEAMSMGKAVVSTSMGAEGLPVKHGENIVLADEPKEFARAVVHLLRDSAARVRLGRMARELVQEKYSWASVAAQFEAVLSRVVGKSGAPEPHRL